MSDEFHRECAAPARPDAPGQRLWLGLTFLVALALNLGAATESPPPPPASVPAAEPVVKIDALKFEASTDEATTNFDNKTGGQTSTELITGKALESSTAQSAADLLKNTPGVTVTKSGDGASSVSIRGLDSRFVRVTVDGQRQGGGAGALDNIPPELLQSLEVTKAITPDMDADSIAGTINITTASTNTKKAYVQGRHQFVTNSLDPRFGLRNTLTLAHPYTLGHGSTPNAGYILTATFDDQNRLREDIRALREWPALVSPGPAPFTGSPVPVLTQPRFEAAEENRQRLGLLFNTDARFGSLTVFLRTNLSRERTDRTRRIDSFDPATGTPLMLAPDFAEFAHVDRDQREVTQFIQRDAGNLNVGGKTTLDYTELDGTLGFGLTRESEPSTREAIFRDTHPQNLSYDLRDDPFLPRLNFIDEVTGLPANSPAPAAQFALHSLAISLSEATDREFTARFNLKHNFTHAAKPDYVKFGGAVQQRHRVVDKDQQFYNPGPVPLTLTGFVDSDLVVLHNGGYRFGPTPDAAAVTALRFTKPDVFALDADKSLINSTTGDTTVTETIWAGYGMGRFEFGPWTILSGIRVEGTHDNASGQQPGASGTFTSMVGRTTYVNVLPGLHLRYEPRPGLVFRGSVTRALSRPAYAELPPSLQINFTDLRSRVGNPSLKPFLADNYDFSVDFLSERLGLFSASPFYKHITNFILDTQKPVIYPTIDPTTTFIEFQRINGGPAETMGLELSWQSITWRLPVEVLGKGSVGLSYTLLHSITHYPDRPGEAIPFYRQPDHQVSFTIRQEGKALSSDFALRYRSAQLEDTIAPGFDNFRAGGFEADFGLAYKYSKATRINVGAANLLNRPIHNFSGTTARMNQFQRPGIDFSVGVQWTR